MTGVLFDLDGTLLDTLEDLTDGVNYALTQFGCPTRSIAHIRSAVGNGALQLIRLSLPGQADDPDADQVLQVYKKYYDAHCRIKTGPYPGVLDALRAIAQKYPVGIVSNKPNPAVQALCGDFFPGIYALGETPDCPRKPAPDMLYKAMKELDVTSCIYVGDTEVDLLTAGNANITCLCVTWGFRDEDTLKAAGGQYLCHRAEDLLPMIEDIMKEESYGK